MRTLSRSSSATDSYSVYLTPRAVDDLREVPFPFRRQINQLFFKLKKNPRPPSVALAGDETCRLPAWSWIILYEVDESAKSITILAIVS